MILNIKDAQGNEIIDPNNIGLINPYRYRSYYYDQETGLYYLQSRYYNPEWGRFLNADGMVSTGTSILGHNMYTYCDNNPVTKYDPTGQWGDTIHKNITKYAINKQLITTILKKYKIKSSVITTNAAYKKLLAGCVAPDSNYRKIPSQ